MNPAVPAAAKRAALVFDDGPIPETGDLLLGVLRDAGAKATFAWIARNLAPNLALAKRALAAGHEAMNHSKTHANLAQLASEEEIREEIVGAQRLFREHLGLNPPCFWLPYGSCDPRTPPVVRQADMLLLDGSRARIVSTGDWDPKVPPEEIRARATRDITDGTVIIFHEWRKETIAVLPSILAELARQRFGFVKVSEILAP